MPAKSTMPAGSQEAAQASGAAWGDLAGSATGGGDWLVRAVGFTVCVLPLLTPAGPGNTALADLGIMAALPLALLWVTREDLPFRLPYVAGVVTMIAGGLLAALVANAPVSVVLVLLQDVILLLWAAVLALGSRHVGIVAAVTRTWPTVAAVYSGVMVLAYVGGLNTIAGVSAEDGVRASYTFGDPNLAGNYLVMSLFVMRACMRPRHPLVRHFAYAVVLLAIVFTGSNGAMLTLATAFVVAFSLERLRSQGVIAALLVLALSAASAMAFIGYVAPRVDVDQVREAASNSIPLLRDSLGRSGDSSGEREVIVREGTRLWLRGDGVGYGPARTKATLSRTQAPYVKEAHNDYLATLLERGVLGAAGLIVLMLAIGYRCVRLATGRLPRAYAQLVPRFWLLAAIAPAMAVAGTFYEVLHFRHLWTWLGLVAALELALLRSADDEDGSDDEPV